MAEKFVVIGSNSFSGAHFVAGALREDAQVLGISRSREPIKAFLPYQWAPPEGASFEFLQCDLNHDLVSIVQAIESFRPDYVVNFAAQSMVAESWRYPEQWFQTNVVANVKLHDRLRHFDFLKRYTHVSTPEVYGHCEGTIDESQHYRPSTPYAVSRAACDMSLMSFFHNYKFPVVFTRAANVYGPGQQLYRIIPRTILSIKLGKTLPLHGGGRSIRSFIHIRDVVEGTLKATRVGRPGRVYHLSTKEFISIRQLVETICAKMGVAFEQVVDLAPERPGKDAAYLLSSQRATEDLEWTDRAPIASGLQETIQWVSDYFEELRRQPLDYRHKS